MKINLTPQSETDLTAAQAAPLEGEASMRPWRTPKLTRFEIKRATNDSNPG